LKEYPCLPEEHIIEEIKRVFGESKVSCNGRVIVVHGREKYLIVVCSGVIEDDDANIARTVLDLAQAGGGGYVYALFPPNAIYNRKMIETLGIGVLFRHARRGIVRIKDATYIPIAPFGLPDIIVKDIEYIREAVTEIREKYRKGLSRGQIGEDVHNIYSTKNKEGVSEEGDLPEFLRDNPWVEILGRRGKEEVVPLAQVN